MTDYVPPGFVSIAHACEAAENSWYAAEIKAAAQQIEAAQKERPRVDDVLGRAISGQFENENRKRALNYALGPIRLEVCRKLRDAFFLGQLTAHYFDPVFGSSDLRSIPTREWATPRVDSVFEIGFYFPLGKPIRTSIFSREDLTGAALVLIAQQELNEFLCGQTFSSVSAKPDTNTKPNKRGRPKGSIFAELDIALFPQIDELLKTGKAQGANGAALLIVKQIAGSGTDVSRAKRVANLYNSKRKLA
ncbi:hypothetical protein [Methylobacterium dankookense]|uniref:Uncharacterized protein n=1 Tax=Methylobacterium dankookense TaxID=560405 RepID=A0A564G177_9HYPH|nr:hypothetical protein [Methylobacterium dankookense]GJD58843.1 hypothetical protein IFDJLNFL_4769 [Methylobacterium dankookense]VUF14185.1 hypothetical protein MTDSW087_03901 [Methylobacterium dankookense]